MQDYDVLGMHSGADACKKECVRETAYWTVTYWQQPGSSDGCYDQIHHKKNTACFRSVWDR